MTIPLELDTTSRMEVTASSRKNTIRSPQKNTVQNTRLPSFPDIDLYRMHQHGTDDHKLVGKRIQEFPEIGDQVILPRELAVQVVGVRRDAEEHQSRNLRPQRIGHHQDNDEYRHQQQAQNGQSVWQIQFHGKDSFSVVSVVDIIFSRDTRASRRLTRPRQSR